MAFEDRIKAALQKALGRNIDITGVTLPFMGVQWQYQEQDKEVVSRLFSRLTGVRLFYDDAEFEYPQACYDSAGEMQKVIWSFTDGHISMSLRSDLNLLSKALARFKSNLDRSEVRGIYKTQSKVPNIGYLEAPGEGFSFLNSLGALRVCFDQVIGKLWDIYGELYGIEPPWTLDPPDDSVAVLGS